MLYEVGSESFPSIQDDPLTQFTDAKISALLQGIVLRAKGGEDLWCQPVIDPSLVGHPRLYYLNGEIVYELCQSGKIVRTHRWKPAPERQSRCLPLQLLKETYPGSHPIAEPHVYLDADTKYHFFHKDHNMRLQALKRTTRSDTHCRFTREQLYPERSGRTIYAAANFRIMTIFDAIAHKLTRTSGDSTYKIYHQLIKD